VVFARWNSEHRFCQAVGRANRSCGVPVRNLLHHRTITPATSGSYSNDGGSAWAAHPSVAQSRDRIAINGIGLKVSTLSEG
jgi:hypothetical protein